MQIGVTLIGIMLGIFSGETLTGDLPAQLARVPFLQSVARPLAVGRDTNRPDSRTNAQLEITLYG